MDQMQNVYIFIDESGTVDLPNDNTLDYYVIVAIIIPENDLEEYKTKSKEIINKYSKGGELKSSHLSNKKGRRFEILLDIKNNRFPFYCLAINKSVIFKESGLRFKQTSYKYLHKLFYQRIRKSFFSMNVIIDNYGTDEFMAGFIKYINSDENLFTKIEYRKCKDEPILQISDIIAGTLRRIFMKEDPKELLAALNYPNIPIEEWPPSTLWYQEESNDLSKYDDLIRNYSLSQARTFLQSIDPCDDIELLSQSLTLRFLLQKFYIDPTKYIFRNEIIEYLKDEGIEISEQVLSTTILAKLRDEGLLLASTDKGIKIPYNTYDIKEWIDRSESQIVPYIKRIERVSYSLLLATNNEYDIVKSNNNSELMKYLLKLFL